MTRSRRPALAALLLTLITCSACSVQINTSSASPSPSTSAKVSPSPSAATVAMVITDQVASGRCETSETAVVSVDGRELGTMKVDDQLIKTDRLSVMVAPGDHKYSLKTTAFFRRSGATFTINGGGDGTIHVSESASNDFQVAVDEGRLPVNSCPSDGGSWPQVLRT